jgi:hypothetical protein
MSEVEAALRNLISQWGGDMTNLAPVIPDEKPATVAASPSAGVVHSSLHPPTLEIVTGKDLIVAPGSHSTLMLRLANPNDGPLHVRLYLTAEMPSLRVEEWVAGVHEVIQLRPHEKDRLVGLGVHAPLSQHIRPDAYGVTIGVVTIPDKTAFDHIQTQVKAIWTIKAVAKPRLLAADSTIAHPTEAVFHLRLRNRGNAPAVYTLHAREPDQTQSKNLAYTFRHRKQRGKHIEVALDPGMRASIALHVHARNPQLFGVHIHRLQVEAAGKAGTPAADIPDAVEVQFKQVGRVATQAPRLPKTLLIIAALLVALGLLLGLIGRMLPNSSPKTTRTESLSHADATPPPPTAPTQPPPATPSPTPLPLPTPTPPADANADAGAGATISNTMRMYASPNLLELVREVAAGQSVKVTGRLADSRVLRIEHDGLAGWIVLDEAKVSLSVPLEQLPVLIAPDSVGALAQAHVNPPLPKLAAAP